MIKRFNRFLEHLFPALIIKRAKTFSDVLEDKTGFSVEVVDSDGTLCFFLIDPYGDPREPDPNHLEADFWEDLDDMIYDLQYFDGAEIYAV